MEIPKRIKDILGKAQERVREYNKPPPIFNNDHERIKRELAYQKKLSQINPRLKTIQSRRSRFQRGEGDERKKDEQ